MKRLITLVLPILLALASGCSTLGPYVPLINPMPENTPDNLTIGVVTDYRPLSFKRKGKMHGFEVDLVTRLAEELDLKPVFIPMKERKFFDALDDRTIDIAVGGIAVSAAKRQLTAFCTPVLKSWQAAATRIERQVKYDNPSSLLFINDNIGVIKGSLGDLLVRENCRKADRVPYPNESLAIHALITGNIEMFIHDYPQMAGLVAKHEKDGIVLLPWKLGEQYLAWAVARRNDDLREKTDEVLKKLMESGEYIKIREVWMPAAKKRRPRN